VLGLVAALMVSADEKPALDAEVSKALTLLNKARKACGLEEVKLSEKLSLGCRNHARYLVINKGSPQVAGLKAHEEQENLKGYTPEGAKAAKASVIHYQPPSQAIEGWMSSFYHRIPLLLPTLREVGIGYHQEGRDTVSLVDCIAGNAGQPTKEIVFYPEDGQKDLPLAFGGEIPNPLPAGHKGPAGFPITVSFMAGQKVKEVAVAVTDEKGAAVPVHVSTPEAPASSWTQWNTVCIIPKQPLAGNTTFAIELKCEVSGKPFARMWKFTTRAQ
jgi:hypothetical protein